VAIQIDMKKSIRLLAGILSLINFYQGYVLFRQPEPNMGVSNTVIKILLGFLFGFYAIYGGSKIFQKKSVSNRWGDKTISRKIFEELIKRYAAGEDLSQYPFEKIIAEAAFVTPLGEKKRKLDADDCMLEVLRIYAFQQSRTSDHYSQAVTQMTPGVRMIFNVEKLSMEVNNGGFSQYFENTRNLLSSMCLEDLKRLGAKETLKLLETAMERIEAAEAKRPPAWETHKVGQVFDYSPIYEGLGDLDNIFYRKLNESLDKLYLKYLKEHPADFLKK
jgi:hypothetical protein